ncbi:uncharacterized protein LOC101751159 isoform X1 [Gallus gallus]|uniref:uncharacterized protein LOC101751159 isoform X1 n=1 Tax=Gallus gallus TaxID=9031 RepID=UPI001AE9BF2C|nr:uncharacterized protein LOC101751159 isoform X1 [Gallus gallus]
MSLMPGIKGCDAVQWHTGSYLTVLLCTHWWKLPWRPRSSEGGMHVCIQMLELLGEAHPSGDVLTGICNLLPVSTWGMRNAKQCPLCTQLYSCSQPAALQGQPVPCSAEGSAACPGPGTTAFQWELTLMTLDLQ